MTAVPLESFRHIKPDEPPRWFELPHDVDVYARLHRPFSDDLLERRALLHLKEGARKCQHAPPWSALGWCLRCAEREVADPYELITSTADLSGAGRPLRRYEAAAFHWARNAVLEETWEWRLGKARERAKGDERRGLRVLSRADLLDLPQPEPLLNNTLDRGTVAVVAGYTGTLKSFVVLSWACNLDTGVGWEGRRPYGTRPVLYIAAEGASGLENRISAWESAHRAKVTRLQVIPQPVNLLDAEQLSLLENVVSTSDFGYDLIVIDTLARCLVGGDENSARDVGMAVDAAFRLRDASGGGTVLLVHHAGKDRTNIRGSSALEAAADTVYLAEGDATHVRLKRTKRKDGLLEDELHLRFRPIPGTGSGVVESHEAVGQTEDLKTFA
jgi:hypothetical protein